MKRLVIFVFIVMSVNLFAVNLVIKDKNVTISCTEMVDDKNITYERSLEIGTYTLPFNTTKVCKKDGIVWINSRELDKCKVIKVHKNNWLELVKSFIFCSPQTVDASSVRGLVLKKPIHRDVLIDTNMNYLKIKSDDFGPGPINLLIYNDLDIKIGNIKKDKIDDDINTTFYIPKNLVREKCTIKVYNKYFKKTPKYIFHIKH